MPRTARRQEVIVCKYGSEEPTQVVHKLLKWDKTEETPRVADAIFSEGTSTAQISTLTLTTERSLFLYIFLEYFDGTIDYLIIVRLLLFYWRLNDLHPPLHRILYHLSMTWHRFTTPQASALQLQAKRPYLDPDSRGNTNSHDKIMSS